MRGEIYQQKFLIHENLGGADKFGAIEPAESLFYACRGTAKLLIGKELFQAQQIQQQTEAIFTTRFKEGLRTDMTLQWGDQTWEILNIQPLGRRDFVDIYAKRRGPKAT